mgnify:CR=1 FL=1
MKYLITFSYNGNYFKGYQKQKNLKTVQGCLEKYLTMLNDNEVVVTSSGRTDVYVHAINAKAHFNLDKNIKYGKKDVKASVLSLIAGIALLGGPTFGIIKLFPPYDDKIPTTKTIYIEDGSSETIDDGYAWKSSIFNDDKNARLKKYYPYEKTKLGNFQRKVEYKNLKIDSTKDIEDNLSIVDISDMVDSTCIQTKDSLNIDDFYTEPYMQIEVTNYDYDNSVKDIRKSF